MRGRSHQIVRPADGISVEATPAVWTIALSPDGRRALYWETAGPDYLLVLHDLAAGTKRQLVTRGRPGAYRMSGGGETPRRSDSAPPRLIFGRVAQGNEPTCRSHDVRPK